MTTARLRKARSSSACPGRLPTATTSRPPAVAAGASALVVERRLGLGVTEAHVDDARLAMAPAAARFFGDPTRQLRVAGITGTNGKTTTAFLVRHILERTGVQTGLLGTVKSVIGGVRQRSSGQPLRRSTSRRSFRAMLDAGDEACAMEVSSHALTLGRARGITFGVGVFTNLTQDHLDFHADMEDYFSAKRLLFEGPERPPVAVVNVDDPFGRRLADEIAGEYGDGPGHLFGGRRGGGAERQRRRVRRCAARASSPAGHSARRGWRCRSPVISTSRTPWRLSAPRWRSGADGKRAAQALSDADRVPGRMEPIDAGQPFAVLVDYAHTPDSLENVLEAARRLTPEPARVICVFGCGGDRDRDKRPLMGAIAVAWLTCRW